MAVIWGLDLREIQWSKFKSSYMWCDRYHLRRTKFIVYQCAMIFCVVSESLGTAALSDYLDQQDYVQSRNPKARVHNNSIIGAFSYNIFVGVYVATIFGAAFFFDLFWPERHESSSVRLAWRICSVVACLMVLSVCLLDTVLVARDNVSITGVSAEEAHRLVEDYHGSPLKYGTNGRAIASVVFDWLGFPATVASTIILWKSYAYNEKNGTSLASHIRHEAEAEKEPGLQQDSPVSDSNTAVAPAAEHAPSHSFADETLRTPA